MPFKSEDQRRYLWANEPEIARDWTDTYGSRIQNNTGGISRLGFANGPNYKVDPNTINQALLEDATSDYQGEEDENYLEKFMRFMQGNAGNLSQADVTANKNFLGNMQFSPNNPYAMTSGPFKGMNAPGTSALGSKNPKEMAQRWVEKYGDVQHSTPEMQAKSQSIKNMATMNEAPPGKASGGRIGFADRGSYGLEQYKKDRSMIDQWMYDQQLEREMIEDLRRKKVKEQKHMAATGGIMRLGYLYGGMSHPGGRRGFPGGAGREDYSPMGTTSSGALSSGANYSTPGTGEGPVSGYIKEEFKKVPESVSSKFLGDKVGGALGLKGMFPQYMLGNILFNKIKGNQSSLDNYQKNYYNNTYPNDSEEETDQKLAKGTTWSEFLQDTSPAAAFDPAIHNSWGDVYQSWLNQNTFS